MFRKLLLTISLLSLFASSLPAQDASVVLRSKHILPASGSASPGQLRLSGFFIEIDGKRVELPAQIAKGEARLADGRVVKLSISPGGDNFGVKLTANPATGVTKWGFAVEAGSQEYFTGVMERVVDGPQQLSWAEGQDHVLNLRGQKIDVILKPTTSVYAPFFISSRGYAVFVKGTWPGLIDFCAADPSKVLLEWEGPSFEMKVYTAADPATLVRAHALDAGPPFVPPKWMYSPWRWRDEHTQRAAYYDGTPVTGPFNSEIMEDVLMMRAFGIPNAVYWIDRPWGPGRLGYDDFDVDEKRLPNFDAMIRWLNGQNQQLFLWIGPFYQGEMEKVALEKHYNLAGQPPQRNNYPLVDFSNPAAKKSWQDGLAKVLKRGVSGYKLDRAEENIPDDGPEKIFDGRSLREQRNDYPAMYLKAAYEEAERIRPKHDFVLMPRAAYTGMAPYGVFWGGDIGGNQEGLRAEIIAVQRAAVMGYPNWGSDTCGYNRQLTEQEVCARWLQFSAFTPIMEVGPTRNVGFWNLPRDPSYDEELIANWRVYGRIHERLADYSYAQAQAANKTGMPIVRPLFLVDPKSPSAWTDWETYLYGPDIVVSPIWKKAQRAKQVYLPSGAQWRDAWTGKTYKGGEAVTVNAEMHQLPLFLRVGAKIDLGDLNKEYADAKAIAAKRPDLKTLDAEVANWFKQHGGEK